MHVCHSDSAKKIIEQCRFKRYFGREEFYQMVNYYPRFGFNLKKALLILSDADMWTYLDNQKISPSLAESVLKRTLDDEEWRENG